jgi:hypothetical protein
VSDFSDNEDIGLEVPTQEEQNSDSNRSNVKLNFGNLNLDNIFVSDRNGQNTENQSRNHLLKTLQEGETENTTVRVKN